jgi:hypothetical protein
MQVNDSDYMALPEHTEYCPDRHEERGVSRLGEGLHGYSPEDSYEWIHYRVQETKTKDALA